MKPQQTAFTVGWFLLLGFAWWIDIFGIPSRATVIESMPTPEPFAGTKMEDNVFIPAPNDAPTSFAWVGPMGTATMNGMSWGTSTPMATPTPGFGENVYRCDDCQSGVIVYNGIPPPAPSPAPQDDATLVIPRVLP